jgi:hypothetical protein
MGAADELIQLLAVVKLIAEKARGFAGGEQASLCTVFFCRCVFASL